MVAELGALPELGDVVRTSDGLLLTVAGLDGRRIDRIRVTAPPAPQPPAEGSAETGS